MSNFLFKGIPLSNVINTISGTTPATGYGFNYNTTNFANSKPLTNAIGYMVNGIDIATNAAANVTTHTNTNALTVNVPSGAKGCRYILRGGGGAGGGGGGGAINFDGYLYYVSGGAAYGGKQGEVIAGTINAITDATYTVIVGSGGPAVAGGGGSGSDGDGSNVKGGDGPTGNPGNVTTFTITGTALSAVGGGGGGGGAGGVAPASGGGEGTTGGGGGITDVAAPTNWDTTIIGPAGKGGARGEGGGYNTNNNNADQGGPSGAGNTGVAQIIWLYG